MKILYIHQYFRTPEEGGAIRSFYFATGLVENNFEVELITAHNRKNYEIKNIKGVKVHYLPVSYANNMRFWARIGSFINFTIKASKLSLSIKGVDICYATSTPLTIGLVSLTLKKIKNIPYIFEVRDLWPEAPVQLGFIKNIFLKHFLYWLEIKIYKEAQAIVALSPGIKEYIDKKVRNKVYMIPNMSDLPLFDKSMTFDLTKDDTSPFVISYFGAIGKANRILSLVNIAKEAQIRFPHLVFKVIGEGAETENLRKAIRNNKLKNISISGPINKKALQEILQATDASYISYENVPVLETSSPNKFFDSLAAGKLIILNIKGWIWDVTSKNSCGIYFDPSIKDDFISKISPFIKDRKLLNQYQLNARKLAEECFDKEKQIKKLVELLHKQ